MNKRSNKKSKPGSAPNRREFFLTGAAAAAACLAPGVTAARGEERFCPLPMSPLPCRPLGRTGALLPLLTFGGGGAWLSLTEDLALRILSEAIDRGVISIDTAYSYGDGKSERIIGTLMPSRRNEVLIHTKVATRDKARWWKELETSLKRLRVDYVDTLMIHHLEQGDDLALLEAREGPLEMLLKAKEQKLTRWVGVSCHTDSAVLARLVRQWPLDHVMVSLNVATNDYSDMGFEEVALPELVSRGIGITAMKLMGTGRIVDTHPDFDYRTCLRYTLSLPVTGATITMPNLQFLQRNIEAVKAFAPFSQADMLRIKEKAAREVRTSFYEFMKNHRDEA